jgi:hypothetical protein
LGDPLLFVQVTPYEYELSSGENQLMRTLTILFGLSCHAMALTFATMKAAASFSDRQRANHHEMDGLADINLNGHSPEKQVISIEAGFGSIAFLSAYGEPTACYLENVYKNRISLPQGTTRFQSLCL